MKFSNAYAKVFIFVVKNVRTTIRPIQNNASKLENNKIKLLNLLETMI
jgi:hypothetical protein